MMINSRCGYVWLLKHFSTFGIHSGRLRVGQIAVTIGGKLSEPLNRLLRLDLLRPLLALKDRDFVLDVGNFVEQNRAGREQLPRKSFAELVAPRLGIGEEEALIAGQPIDHRRGLAAE